MSKNIFLKNNEGKLHASAKNKLFQLLIDHKVHLLDSSGYEYEIFPQVNTTEFLHLEPFTVNYKNHAIYSDIEMHCLDVFGLEGDKVSGYCNFGLDCGVCWELPCRECIEYYYKPVKNINPIGFTPDIAYGYDGKYIIWIEICNTHPATSYKIEFCKKNNIILLEVSAIDIELLNDSFLMVMNRTSKNYWDAINDIYENNKMKMFDESLNKIIDNINIKGYSLYSEYARKNGFKKYIEEKGFDAMQLSKIVKEKYSVTEDGYPWIVIRNENFKNQNNINQ